MSENGVNNAGDTDMADCDGEKVVTMMDVLQEQQDFEDDANAVLGASDEKNCTYSKGYIKRQAIYACLTCCSEAKDDPTKRAGVCLACSLNCHENHELIELYTKRNFRCDCGNPKFNHPCQYTPNKDDLNVNNKYNQNFSGLYCNCHRPYPDPEATEEDEMIQCIICEDWLHSAHLDAVVPSNEQYAEMVCKACMDENEFLHDYTSLAVNIEPELDVTSLNDTNVSIANGLEESQIENGVDKAPEGSANMDVDDKDPGNEDTKATDITMQTEKTESQSSEINTEKALENSSEQATSNSFEDKAEENPDTTDPIDSTEDMKGDSNDYIKVDSANGSTIPTEDADSTSDVLKDNLEEPKNHDSDNIGQEGDGDLKNEKVSDDKDNEKSEPSSDINIEPTSEMEQSKKNDTAFNASETNESTKVTSETSDNPKPMTTEYEVKNNDLNENSEKPEIGIEECVDNSNSEIPNEIDKKISDENQKDSPENGSSTTEHKENKRKFSVDEEINDAKKLKLEESKCSRPKGVQKLLKGAVFWPSNFRQKLCTCAECLAMYNDLSVLFLVDPEDTVSAYETLGKERKDHTTQYEKGLEALSSLDRIQQINALTEYNKMRDKLLDYLKSFKDRKEIVKEEDIKAFFSGMKPKREPDGVYFCR